MILRIHSRSHLCGLSGPQKEAARSNFLFRSRRAPMRGSPIPLRSCATPRKARCALRTHSPISAQRHLRLLDRCATPGAGLRNGDNQSHISSGYLDDHRFLSINNEEHSLDYSTAGTLAQALRPRTRSRRPGHHQPVRPLHPQDRRSASPQRVPASASAAGKHRETSALDRDQETRIATDLICDWVLQIQLFGPARKMIRR